MKHIVIRSWTFGTKRLSPFELVPLRPRTEPWRSILASSPFPPSSLTGSRSRFCDVLPCRVDSLADGTTSTCKIAAPPSPSAVQQIPVENKILTCCGFENPFKNRRLTVPYVSTSAKTIKYVNQNQVIRRQTAFSFGGLIFVCVCLCVCQC